MDTEIWKDIPWFEWKYQVSNLWRIKSNFKILNPITNRDGYKQTVLLKDKIRKTVFIHRMVLLAFLWKSTLQVNHKNWIRNDNRIENLEWCTYTENSLHAYRVLWRKMSSEHPFLKNPFNKWSFWKLHHCSKWVIQLSKDWIFIKKWNSQRDIQRELWINSKLISRCCKWKRKTTGWFIWEYDNVPPLIFQSLNTIA
jgi:hypothetical protein